MPMLNAMMTFSDTPAGAWTGRVLSTLVVLFLIFDGLIKLLNIEAVQKATLELGYPQSTTLAIGIIVLTCAALYAFPRTAVLGAVLVTALCGGAIASQLRIGSPMFSHVLFGFYLALVAWGGLWLRSDDVRSMLPLTASLAGANPAESQTSGEAN
jgi:hypothetical protein